jgi:hypothetical protein
MSTLSENAKQVTAKEGYEVGYSGKADNKNPYVPGELHDIWQSNYERGVKQRLQDDGKGDYSYLWF